MYNVITMAEKSYKSLKSGIDLRGVAVQTEENNVTLTNEAICDLTKAFLKWISDKTGKTCLNIAVGHDVRISSEAVFSAVQKSIIECGCNVFYCGLSSTPSMYMLLKDENWDCDASIMITASHLPFYMNGLKLFTPEGALGSADIDKIIELAENGESLPRRLGNLVEQSYMDAYCKKLVAAVRTQIGKSAPLFGKKVIVDASNGVGAFFVKKVLQQLGATTDGSINLNPDGNFPAHAPNPKDGEVIKALSDAVVSSKAELGIVFDADANRVAVVNSEGKPINKDNLIALTAAAILMNAGGEGSTIVTDSATTDGLTEFIEKHGGKHVRYKHGHRNVAEEAIRRNKKGEHCPVAIETNGHAAFEDNGFLDDGAYLVCKILITYVQQAARKMTLGDLISSLVRPVEEKEIRIGFTADSGNYRREGERIVEEFKYFADCDKRMSVAPDYYDGVRVNFTEDFGNGWLLLRQSIHHPVMIINMASMQAGGNKIMARQLFFMLEKYPFLDVTELKNFILTK